MLGWCTRKVIPKPRCLEQRAWMSGPHTAEIFPAILEIIWFMWSPVGINWNRLIRPDELVRLPVPLETNPNLFPWRGMFSRERQDELVFFCVSDFHQFSFSCFAERLGLVPSPDVTSHQITISIKPGPTRGTRSAWKYEENQPDTKCYSKKKGYEQSS